MIENLKWDNRLSGETPLRQMQLVGLRLLRVLDAVCKEIGVEYIIMYGTLLGAVRHKGFIPWDDDIDLVMTEENYKKFLREARRYLPSDVYLESPFDGSSSHLSWAKLRDAYSSVYSNESELKSGAHFGISLDIFPWYSYPKGLLGKLAQTLQIVIYTARRWSRIGSGASWYSYVLKPVGTVLYPIAWFILRLLSSISTEREFGMLPDVASTCRFLRYKYKDIYPLKVERFEGLDFPAPNNAAEVLRIRYGSDYMLPPHESWKTPHAKYIKPTQACMHLRAMKWPN